MFCFCFVCILGLFGSSFIGDSHNINVFTEFFKIFNKQVVSNRLHIG